MHCHLFFLERNIKKFKERLQELNRHLKHFPVPQGRTAVVSLAEDELLEIIDRAKPLQCQQALLLANCDPHSKSLNEYSQHLERLEASAKIEKALGNNNKSTSTASSSQKNDKKRKRSTENKNSTSNSAKGSPACKTCGRMHRGPC